MKKNERKALVVLSCILLICVIVFIAVPKLMQHFNNANMQRLADEYGVVAGLGEEIHLSADTNESPKIDGPFPGQETVLEATFPFSGSLFISVNDATIFDNPLQANPSLNNSKFFGSAYFPNSSNNEEDFALLMCDITIRNENAAPIEQSVTRNGKLGFMFNGVLAPYPYAELVYFDDGTNEYTDDGDRGYFALSQGEEKHIRAGYAIKNENLSSGQIEFRCGSNESLKYRIMLEAIDMRKESHA